LITQPPIFNVFLSFLNNLTSLVLVPVYAQSRAQLEGGRISVQYIVDAVARGFNILLLSAGAVFIGYVILSAYKFASAEGDSKAVQGAKQSLTHAVIGLLIVVGVFSINIIVINILGLSGGGADFRNPQGLFDMIKSAISDIEDYAGVETP